MAIGRRHWALPAVLIAAAGAGWCADALERPVLGILEAARQRGLRRLSLAEIRSDRDLADLTRKVAQSLFQRLSAARSVELVESSEEEKAGRGAEAVILGSILRDEGKNRLFASMVEADTAKVLYASVWDLEESAPPGFGPGGAGDSGSSGSDPCRLQLESADMMEAGLLDAKAKFWAHRIREDGYTYEAMAPHLGTEIQDLGLRAVFYQMLKTYHAWRKPPKMSRQEIRRLQENEKQIVRLRSCGG